MENNEIFIRELVRKINETWFFESWFSEDISKMYDLCEGQLRKKTQIISIRNKTESFSSDTMNIGWDVAQW